MRFGIFIALTAGILAPAAAPNAVRQAHAAVGAWSLPPIDDAELVEKINDPRTRWYTSREIPPAYQFSLPGQPQATVHSAHYNISGRAGERTGHSFEFPWRHPGGTDTAPAGTVASAKFVWLPPGASVRYQWQLRPQGRSGRQVRYLDWRFPVDTTFGEVLAIRDSSGTYHPFEIRTRTREADAWGVDLFRHFGSVEELRAAGLSVSEVQQEIRDDHAASAFNESAPAWSLEERLSPDQVAEHLRQPLRSVLGTSFALTQNTQDFHVVPRNYFGSVLGTDRESCSNCHQHAGQHVDDFDPRRDWYGWVRGNDGILSWHPFAAAAISTNGAAVPVSFRPTLGRAGASHASLARRNSSAHETDRLRGLSDLGNRSDPLRDRNLSQHSRPDVARLATHGRHIDYDLIARLIVGKIKSDPDLQEQLRGRRGPAGSPGTPGPAGPRGVPGADAPDVPMRFQVIDEAGTVTSEITRGLGDTVKLRVMR